MSTVTRIATMSEIEAVAHQIVERQDPQRSVLFASYARGVPTMEDVHQEQHSRYLSFQLLSEPTTSRLVVPTHPRLLLESGRVCYSLSVTRRQ